MAYVPHSTQLGRPPIASTLAESAAGALPLGRGIPGPNLGDIIRAEDPVYGVGEFIYLRGCAGTVVGSVVTYDAANAGNTGPGWTTALLGAVANQGRPVAVAMSANLAGFDGWYQIAGSAVVAAAAVLAAGASVFAAGAGQLTSTVAAGMQVLNAKSTVAAGTPAAGQAIVQIDRPFMQGQIT